MWSKYDIDQLVKLLKNKSDQFSILSLNIQSINAKFDQLRNILEGLERQNCKFSVICLQETWLSEASDISLLLLDNYNFISQDKICSSHEGLAIYLLKKYDHKTLTIYDHSNIWEGQFIEIFWRYVTVKNCYR